VVIAAVGDMVCPPGEPTSAGDCHEQGVSNLVVADSTISAFLALGDLQYENGELANFYSEYHPTYGRFLQMTYPVPGNREYNTPNASGYFDYFGARAGDRNRGYYSFDLGQNWHIVALNSNCSVVSCATFSLQEQWLRADLSSNVRPCILAFWHHPIFTSAVPEAPSGARVPLWQALQDFGADVVLNGHQHVYERFGRQLANGTASAGGIRQFVVGTGGEDVAPIGAAKANSEVRIARTFGLLKMNLAESGFAWSFVGEDSRILDSGADTCTP
jgi:acid phosphatase type 7